MRVTGSNSHKCSLMGCLIDEVGCPPLQRSVPNTPASHSELCD